MKGCTAHPCRATATPTRCTLSWAILRLVELPPDRQAEPTEMLGEEERVATLASRPIAWQLSG